MAKILMTALFAAGMMLGMAGIASAATISCGGCHGATSKTPSYESHGLPLDADNCTNDARGLHGVHGNYSSASYAMSNYGSRGTCSYCHTSSGGGHPTATHNNGYVNITGSIGSGRQNWVTTGLDYDKPTSTCTNACHKNEGATAKWGNYTAVSGGISLTCNSCHDDSSAGSISLSGAHAAHLGTAITVTGLGANNNTDCDACHPDNTGDLWSAGQADDGTVKAYPHASDGTNVNEDNAALDAGISATRSAGATDTCAGACHQNATNDQWGAGSLSCDSCHNSFANASTNNAAVVSLGGAHSAHFGSTIGGMTAITCSNCHSVPSDTAHVSSLPVGSDNASLIAGVNATRGAGATDTCAGACHQNSSDDQWGAGTLTCSSCHNATASAGFNDLSSIVSLGGSHSVHFGYGATCTDCHGTLPTDTGHASAFPIAADNATVVLSSGDWNDGANTCANYPSGCHSSATARTWGAVLSNCNDCHNYPTAYSNWTGTNGHAVQYDTAVVTNTHLPTASFFNVSSNTYNEVCADVNSCGKCHYGLNEATHHKKLGVNVVPASGNGYCSGEMSIDVTTSGSNVSCSNAKCHSGKTTPNWW